MKVNLKTRINYALDNYMARGTKAMVGGLAIISIFVVVVVAGIITLGRIPINEKGQMVSFFEASWISLVRTLDPGVMGSDTGLGFRAVAFFVTLSGIFIISTLIGVIANAVEEKMKELRKGRSTVIENGHIVILGWSSQIFCVISELLTAANGNYQKIVILSDRDKVDMEEQITRRLGSKLSKRVICRKGRPLDCTDLQMVSINTSKSVIILSPEIDNPDAETIKTILAITRNRNGNNHLSSRYEASPTSSCLDNNGKATDQMKIIGREEPYHIIAEIKDPKNENAAIVAGRNEVELIFAHAMISRIIAQTCRQPGLSVIYEELLNFDGDEIYTKHFPSLEGKTFKEALLLLRESTLIGICSENMKPQINPPMDTIINATDKIIAISQTQETIRISSSDDIECMFDRISIENCEDREVENILILGWNDKVSRVIDELSYYVLPGSEVTLISNRCATEVKRRSQIKSSSNLVLNCIEKNVTEWNTLNEIDIQKYNSIIVLPNHEEVSNDPDASTLITLLHIRELVDEKSCSPQIVSEIVDLRNKQLAEVTRANDFIVSDRLISLMLAQIANSKENGAIFNDIFDAEGSEIYLKNPKGYVKLGIEVNFRTVIEAASMKSNGEVAIGYRLKALCEDSKHSFGIRINPPKDERVVFSEGDSIIVISDK